MTRQDTLFDFEEDDTRDVETEDGDEEKSSDASTTKTRPSPSSRGRPTLSQQAESLDPRVEKALLNRAQRRKVDVERKLKELELKEKNGELVKAKDIKKEFENVFMRARSLILNIPDYCDDLAEMNKNDMRDYLIKKCDEILLELSGGDFV